MMVWWVVTPPNVVEVKHVSINIVESEEEALWFSETLVST
jgi:hypothetical protein